MIAATDERSILARLERLEKISTALTCYIREREIATNPTASNPGSTAEVALIKMLKSYGESP